MYLLDTNAISEMRKAKQGKASPSFVQWADSVDDATLCTCAVVMMELERGVLGMERKDPAQGLHLRRWLDGHNQTAICWPHPADRRRHRRNLRPPARP